MSRHSPANGQVRSRIASLVAIVSVLVLTACGSSDPTAPTTDAVNMWAVRAVAPCANQLLQDGHGAGRSAAGGRIQALGSTVNASATARCGLRPLFEIDADVATRTRK
jgi:hypothetical protein